MSASYRFVVTGRVQGVFFRQSTCKTAVALDLRGWVMNRADGCVEGIASGQPDALDQFQAWLHRGPAAARVDAVEWHACESPQESDFRVRR